MAYFCQMTQDLIHSGPHVYDWCWNNLNAEDCEFSAITPDIHRFPPVTNDCVFDNSNLNLHSDSDSYYTGSRPSSTQLSENEFNNYSNIDLSDDTTYLLSLPNSNDWTLSSSNRHDASPPASLNYIDNSRLSPMMSEISFYEDISSPPGLHAPAEGRRTPPPPYRPPVNNVDTSCESVTLETMLLKLKPPPSYTETVNSGATQYGSTGTLSDFTVNSGFSQNSPLTADRSQSAMSTSSDLEMLPRPSAFQVGGFREQRAVGEETGTEALVPADPELWEKDHIDHWLTKVENYYCLSHIDRTHMPGDGKSLCRLSADDFHRIVGDRRAAEILSSYLDCIRQNIKFSPQSSMENTGETEKKKTFFEAIKQIVGKNPQKKSSSPAEIFCQVKMKGKSFKKIIQKKEGGGQIQLWQFLLELLLDPKYSSYIGWQDENGTFRFFDPDGTAKLWGERKLNESKTKKPMTYDKLSRSLRHYYDKGIVIKPNGQKYTYKFNIEGILRACSPSGVSDSIFIYPNFDPKTCDNSSPRNFNLNLQ